MMRMLSPAIKTVFAAICLFTVTASPSSADPVGKRNVIGTNEDGSEYTGTVRIERKGQIYRVTWSIAGQTMRGTGIGGRLVDGTPSYGAASPEDTLIGILYDYDRTSGIALYAQQTDGSWKGVWTVKGSQTVLEETWDALDSDRLSEGSASGETRAVPAAPAPAP